MSFARRSISSLALTLAACASPAPAAPAVTSEALIAAPRGVLEPDDGAASDEFGNGVAITPARDWIFVGAPYHALNGAVYAFARTATGWELRATITADDGRDGDRFGHAIATDGARVAIGAPGDEAVVYDNAGSVYVYRIEAGGLVFEQRLDNPDPMTGNEFYGYALAFVDGSTLAVGAPSARAFFFGAGAAYVYERTGTTWALDQALEPSTLSTNDSLGSSIAANATTIVVGAPYDDGVIPDSGGFVEENVGAAFVFVRGSTGAWEQQARLGPTTERSWEHVGTSVAIDPTGTRVATGAPGADDDESLIRSRGVAYVFARSGTTWSQEARLYPAPMSDWTDLAYFGNAIALEADQLVVGAPGAYRASLGRDPGFAYVYSRAAAGWSPELDVTGRLRTVSYGDALALVGGTLAVGAPGEDVTGADGRGAAYAYELVDPRADGEPCATGVECVSGFCADGVCCDSACGGGAIDCLACSVAAGAATDGVCATARADATCRAASSACDVAEVCDGSAITCPVDVTEADGTACDDGLACNGADACSGGACVAGTTSLDCDDGDACTADSCADPDGCAHTPIAGCVACEVASDCPATGCSPAMCQDGVCTDSTIGCDAGGDDASIDPDAGMAVDGGPTSATSGGCGCAIPGARGPGGGARGLGALAIVLAIALARRRSCRS